MASSIGWLHLTDLHVGLAVGRPLLPTMREEFFADLARLHRRAGPWDVVLFTGDLTQRGNAGEFAEFDEVMARLFAHLESLGSKPILVAVPGNHDLVRPDARSAVVRALRTFHDDNVVSGDFWDNQTGEYRNVVKQAFAAFDDWSSAQRMGAGGLARTKGVLPGDHSVTIEKEGLLLGIVGLNSAFLQLTGDNFEGRLSLDVRQLHTACGGDVADWSAAHHASLLLTHHPISWLHASAQETYRAEIYPPGRFIAHLYGHMHEPGARIASDGGAAPRRHLQGASLFGLETWGDGQQQRVHGYSAARLTVDGPRSTLRIWPRIAQVQHAGHRRMVPDHSFELDDDDAFTLVFASRSLERAAPLSRRRWPHPQNAGYDPEFYLRRDAEEDMALRRLARPGRPVVLQAPHGYGKTTMVEHLLAECTRAAAEEGGAEGVATVRLDLADTTQFPPESFADAASFFRRLGERIAAAVDPDRADEMVDEAWRRRGTHEDRLSQMMRTQVLAGRHRVFLLVDGADALIGRSYGPSFFGLLRAWSVSHDEVWDPLRILLTIATLPARVDSNRQSFFVGVAEVVELRTLDDAQLAKLAAQHGLKPSPAALRLLAEVTGGHPFLARLALFRACEDEVALERLLDPLPPGGGIFRQHLEGMHFWLDQNKLLPVVCGMLAQRPVWPSYPDYCQLYGEGLLNQDERGRYRFCARIYEDYFGGVCRGD